MIKKENAGMNSKVQLGRTAVNSHAQVNEQVVDMRNDSGKAKQKSVNYL